jgi:energy-converting hydrogenase Eha subunit C
MVRATAQVATFITATSVPISKSKHFALRNPSGRVCAITSCKTLDKEIVFATKCISPIQLCIGLMHFVLLRLANNGGLGYAQFISCFPG